MRQTLLALRERAMNLWAARALRIFGGLAFVLFAFVLVYSASFGPADSRGQVEEFIVKPDESVHDVAMSLEDAGIIRFWWAFESAYVLAHPTKTLIRPGGYTLSRSMDTGSIVDVFGKAPYLIWFTMEPGLRKEQIAELLTQELSWTSDKTAAWLSTSTLPDHLPEDGAFYPDIYLIPSDQAPLDVRARFQARFNEATKDLQLQAIEEGKDWKEVIILASLVEREAAKNDKPLVAGILQNRIKRGMPLAVDAALQYVEGKVDGVWWRAPNPDTKYIDSAFNTYKNTGLPPSGIAQPSLESIEAVLNPDATSCLFYIHGARGRIHCSPTYAGHKANINRYLR